MRAAPRPLQPSGAHTPRSYTQQKLNEHGKFLYLARIRRGKHMYIYSNDTAQGGESPGLRVVKMIGQIKQADKVKMGENREE